MISQFALEQLEREDGDLKVFKAWVRGFFFFKEKFIRNISAYNNENETKFYRP